MSKSIDEQLDEILSKIEAYQWDDDPEPTIDATTLLQAKQAILKAIEKYYVPKDKIILKALGETNKAQRKEMGIE